MSSRQAIAKYISKEIATRARGTGGRSSYNGLTVTVFNASSRIGQEIIGRLGGTGCQLVVAYRGDRSDAEDTRMACDLGQIYYAPYHLKDDYSLYEAMKYSNVVVNCIGRDFETRNFSLDDVHVDGPRRMARIARECGVRRFMHFSHLHASPNPEPKILKGGSPFLKSKYAGEVAVREEFPDATIFRPADILGEHDRLLHHFCGRWRSLNTKKLELWDFYDEVIKAPVFRGDVVKALAIAIKDPSTRGQIYQAIGPHRYNFFHLIQYMRWCASQFPARTRHTIGNLRLAPFMRLFITFNSNYGGYFTKSPWIREITWDRVERDLISDDVNRMIPTIADLGVKLTNIEPIIASYGKNFPGNLDRDDQMYFNPKAPPIPTPPRVNELIH